MALSLNRWKTCFPLYAAVFVSFLTVLLFFMSDRYRLPSVPFLLIFAVFGVRQLISFAGDRKWRPLFFTILLLAGGFLLTCLPLSGEVPNVSAYFNLARIYERSGWAGRAVAAYEKAILINATAKADAIVTGACLSVTAAGDQRAPGGAAAIFEIREVLKGPVSAARIKLPCRLSGEASASPAGREPLPFFQTGEHFLLYLKEGMDPRFTVMGGPYGQYPLVKDMKGEWRAYPFLPLNSLQSTIPDTRPPIPLKTLKEIIQEILDNGDFKDRPGLIDTSLSRREIQAFREERSQGTDGAPDRNFWRNR